MYLRTESDLDVFMRHLSASTIQLRTKTHTSDDVSIWFEYRLDLGCSSILDFNLVKKNKCFFVTSDSVNCYIDWICDIDDIPNKLMSRPVFCVNYINLLVERRFYCFFQLLSNCILRKTNLIDWSLTTKQLF